MSTGQANVVVTVTGVLAPATIGVCSLGEHLVASFAISRPKLASDAWFFEQPVRIELIGDLMLGRANRDDATLEADEACTELERYAALGGGLVLELTEPVEGRDAAALRSLSEQTGVRVVMATGSRAQTAPELIDELSGGVHGVRAGVITAHAGAELGAVWEAARATGAPVVLDGGGEIDATLAALRAAQAVGVGADRIAVRSAQRLAPMPEHLDTLARTGAYLLFDRLGRIPTIYTTISDHEIAVAIATLAGAGHAERILLGAGVDRKHALTSFGGHGLRFIPTQFLPYLANLGLGAEQAHALTTSNPARFLTWTEPPA